MTNSALIPSFPTNHPIPPPDLFTNNSNYMKIPVQQLSDLPPQFIKTSSSQNFPPNSLQINGIE
jgi:hypothetical protein